MGKYHTEDSKQKISLARKGVPNPKNSIPRTEEQKEHLRKINSGKIVPKSVIEKITQSKLKNPFKHSEEFKEKMRVPKTKETRLKMKESQNVRRSTKKEKWITNGVDNRLVNSDLEIPTGWNSGRTTDTTPPSQKGKFWINNGVENRMSADIPSGWHKGRLYKRKEK